MLLQYSVIPADQYVKGSLLRATRCPNKVPMMQVEKVKKAVETAKQLRSDLYLEGECEAGCRFVVGNSPTI